MFDGIFEAIHRELDALDEKYSTEKAPMNPQDLDHIDKMAHSLKCLIGYEMYLKGKEESGSYRRRYDGYRRY